MSYSTKVNYCSHNLPEYCIAFHGLARAGLTVTTCNPVYTVEETQHQLRDSNAKAVITVTDYLDKVKQITAGLNNCQKIWVMGEFAGPGGYTNYISINRNKPGSA